MDISLISPVCPNCCDARTARFRLHTLTLVRHTSRPAAPGNPARHIRTGRPCSRACQVPVSMGCRQPPRSRQRRRIRILVTFRAAKSEPMSASATPCVTPICGQWDPHGPLTRPASCGARCPRPGRNSPGSRGRACAASADSQPRRACRSRTCPHWPASEG